jgi:hypothetical protein
MFAFEELKIMANASVALMDGGKSSGGSSKNLMGQDRERKKCGTNFLQHWGLFKQISACVLNPLFSCCSCFFFFFTLGP